MADIKELIEKWHDLLSTHFEQEIMDAAVSDEKVIVVPFNLIDRVDIDLAESILNHPDTAIYAASEALNMMDLPTDNVADISFRISNLPSTSKVKIRDLRQSQLGKLVCVEGVVRRATEVKPRVEDAVFQCQKCGAIIKTPQEETTIKEPLECYEDQGGCGRKSSFKMLMGQSRLIDFQKIELQESPEGLPGGSQPEKIAVLLTEDLTGKIFPGDRVAVNGIFHAVRKMRGASALRVLGVAIDGNHIDHLEKTFEEIEISEKDEREIVEMSKQPDLYRKMVESIAPQIYGMEHEKEAILLQLFGGVPRQLSDEMRVRGDIHLLLVGDPGLAKCVSGDTEVFLADGSLHEIKSMVNDETSKKISGFVDDGIYVETNHDLISLGLNGKNVDSTGNLLWKRSTPPKMYRIVTGSGKEIKITPTHPFFVCKDARIKRRSAEDLREGEFIATPRKIDIFGTPQSLNINYRRSRANNAVRLKLPNHTTPQFWRFIGLFIAEGYLESRVQNGYPQCTAFFTNNNSQLIEEYRTFAKKLGLNPSYRHSHKGKSAKEIYTPSIEFGTFLENLGAAGPSRSKIVPEILFKCSKREIAAFLSALFDGEGTVSKKIRKIGITSASGKLLSQVQHLLLRFGIHSQLHPTLSKASNSPHPRKKEYYRLCIMGEEVMKFAREIGFTVAEKKETLQKMCNSTSIYNTNVDVIPNISSLLKEIRTKLRLSQFECGISRSSYQHYEKGDRNPSRLALNIIVRQFEERINWFIEAKKRSVSSNNWHDLKSIRKSLRCSQKRIGDLAGLSQTLLSQYETRKIGHTGIKTKKKSVTKNKVSRALLKCINESNDVIDLISALKTVANADIFWDRIKKIEDYTPEDEFVYDIQVPDYHNFIANDIYVHNSQLLRYASRLAPRSILASGKTSSAAGLTASAVRDEFGEGRWTLEAGAMVLADMGMLCIDEIDKMNSDDRESMHPAMEQQEIQIAKAGIVATLKTRCSLMACANPKFGKFDMYANIAEQINIPPTLLSRFDLIFPVMDESNRKRDTEIADHIMNMRKSSVEPCITTEMIRKYVAYAKCHIQPNMTDEAKEMIKEFYAEMRSLSNNGETIPVTPRQLESTIRLSEAAARARLNDKVETEDAQKAIGIIKEYIRRVGIDTESGMFDMGAVLTGKTHSQHSRMKTMDDIISTMCKRDGLAERGDIIREAERQGIDPGKAEESLDHLAKEGHIYDPKRDGRYRLSR